MRLWRKIEGIKWLGHITNEEVLNKIKWVRKDYK